MAFGVTLLSENLIPRSYGFSLLSSNNLIVKICDELNNDLTGTITITGGSNIDGAYSGFDEYPFDVDADYSNITFEASASGYITDSIVTNVSINGLLEIKFNLIADVVEFSCTTLFKNSDGVTINEPINSGYVEVTFSGSTNFNKDDYQITFEAMASGSSKYSSLVLESELIDEQTDSISYKVSVVPVSGDYCYISNIVNKLC